ncbi:uncharacterized protein V6R79_002741 [Siganus canaliculatus]
MEQRLETAFVAARLNSTEAHERQKLYYDSESCHRAYGVGELVWLNNPTENRTKLAPHWRGPYRVVQVLASGGEAALTYRIVNHLDPQERAQVVHHDRLKRYTLPMPPAVEPPTVFETSAPGSVVVSLPRVSEQLVANHHNPKPSVIVQRFKFHSHFRRQGQSVANFVAELRQLSEHCDFGPVLDDMLRDRLVCGINNDATQRRLLGEAPPLTFKKALEISQGMEMAANNAKDIQKGHGGAQAAVVHQVKGETVKHAKRVECFRCGGAHYANDCKFKDAICHACSKKGHLAKKCRQEKGKRKPGAGKTHQSQAPTHHLEEEGVCSYNMFAVEVDEETDEEPPEPYYATVKVVGQDITFEVDSGATASVISEETYRKTWGSNPPPLRKSRLRLRTYTGQPIPHCGVIYVDIAAEVSYVVQLADGRIFRRHQDHVRLRHDSGLASDCATEYPVVRSTTVEVDPQESETHTEVSGPPREDEHSHTGTEIPLSVPIPDPPKTPTPAVSAGTPKLVRRSERTRKAPDRLKV